MKVLVARLNHETNTFSPIVTDLESFSPVVGDQARLEQLSGRTAMTAFLNFVQSIPNVELVTPLSAMANPSGPVQPDAFNWLSERILEEATDTDLFLLDLHGAMVVDGGLDGEGELLESIRARAPTAKIMVSLDLHANVTPKMVDNVDVMVSFKTYPHVDMYETGALVAHIAGKFLDEQTQPVTAWCQIPLLSHTLRSNTNEGAMQHAVEFAKRAEKQDGVLAVSIVAGFSLSDFPDAGMSVLVVASESYALAQKVANQIAQDIWRDRDEFVYKSVPLSESLVTAKKLSARSHGKPLLLLDHSDNVMSGGTCDTMDVLVAALNEGLESIAVGPICDPLAVRQLLKGGVGSTLTLEIGNRFPRPIAKASPEPAQIFGKVLAISDGDFTVRGPIYTGSLVSMGPTVAFDIGKAVLVVTEKRTEPFDLGIFECVNVNPAEFRFVLLKSRMYCRPVFGPICAEIIECDSDFGGPTSSDYRYFKFTRLRKPIFPLQELSFSPFSSLRS